MELDDLQNLNRDRKHHYEEKAPSWIWVQIMSEDCTWLDTKRPPEEHLKDKMVFWGRSPIRFAE